MSIDYPVYLLLVPPEGEMTTDKDGNPIRIITWNIKGLGVEAVKQMFRAQFKAELSDEKAQMLNDGGWLRLV